MSIVKLNSGKFVVLSTVEVNPEMKLEIDSLTNNGELIESSEDKLKLLFGY